MNNASIHRISRLLMLTAVCAALFLGPARTAQAEGPLDAISKAQAAIDDNDPDTFKKYVDINAVLNKGMDDLITALKAQAADGSLEGNNAVLLLILASLGEDDQGKTEFLKQLLASEMKTFVTTGISGGYFAGKPTGKVKPSGLTATLLKSMSKGRKEIVPGKVISLEDGQATVTGTFVDKKAGSFPLELRMEKTGEHWQVKEVLNAEELAKQASKGKR